MSTEEKTWEQWADDFHATVLEIIEGLVAHDPPADSPEGVLLTRLASAAENYEKARWPIEPPEPELLAPEDQPVYGPKLHTRSCPCGACPERPPGWEKP